MSKNNHLIMRIVLGAVLAFQGAKLLSALLQDKPENYLFMAVIAIVFIAIGGIFAVTSIKQYIAFTKEGDMNIIRYEDMKKDELESKETVNEKEGEEKSCE